MPRPKTKNELLELSQKNYDRLIELVDSYNAEELDDEFPEKYLNRNIRDVLAHLHHWHLLFLKWYAIGMAGNKPEMPAEGYTWKTVPELNRAIREKYEKTDLIDILNLLEASYNDVQRIIEKHDENELFEKKRYPWTGTTSLASYLISTTSSHYDWAFKLIKQCKKEKIALG